MNTNQFELLENFKKDVMRRLNPTINNMVISLDAISDFRLGALLGLISEEWEFKYIKSLAQTYAGAVDRIIMNHFSELEYTEEDIEKFIKAPENSEYLLKCSPSRELSENLPYLLSTIVESNRTKLSTDSSLSVCFNSRYFEVPEDIQNEIRDSLSKHLAGGDITFRTGPLESMSSEELMKFDTMVIYYLNSFFKDQRVSEMILEKGTLLNMNIYGIFESVADIEDEASDEFKTMVAATESALNLVCQFKFVDNKLLF